jgi:hypothetical protein
MTPDASASRQLTGSVRSIDGLPVDPEQLGELLDGQDIWKAVAVGT